MRDEKGRFVKGNKESVAVNIGRKHTEEEKLKMSESHKGCKHPNWQGGKYRRPDGYIMIYKPEHPFASVDGYVREHRLIMEEALGRYLTPKEIVHHKNEIIDDNRIENLELFANKGEHVKYHLSIRYMAVANA